MKFLQTIGKYLGLASTRETKSLSYMNRVDAALYRKPLIGAGILSLGTVMLVILFLTWASYAELDEVTHGQGQVVSAQRTQEIQHLEGGILQAILVREGQTVEKNAPLAQIEDINAKSAYKDAMSKALEHRVALIRLEAENANEPPQFGEDLMNEAPQIVRDQRNMYRSREDQHESELQMLESQYKQRLNDVQEQTQHKVQLERSLALATKQCDITRPLVKRKIYSELEYLGQEQKVVALQSDIGATASALSKAEEAANEAKNKIAQRKAEISAEISEEINKRRTELASLEQTLSAGKDRVTRTEVRSPVYGVIKQININTVGGVVRPGESIMDVVPLDDTLLIETRIRPADIAFISPAQKAMVKITAYDFSIYGGLEAVVEQISADTIEDKRGEFFYIVKLRTSRNAITYHGRQLPIIPGMMATADILTGKKTVLDYLLKPILKAKQNALRER